MPRREELEARVRMLAEEALRHTGGDLEAALKRLTIEVQLDPELDKSWRVATLRRLLEEVSGEQV